MQLFRIAVLLLGVVGTHARGKKMTEEEEHMANGAYDDAARAAGARDYEVENLRKYRAGEMSDAELGLKNMAGAMKDPAAMAELAKMMKDPDTMRQVQQMMQDPSFQAQAKAAMQQMAASGAMPSQEQMQQMMNDPEMIKKAQAMAQAMGMGAGSMGAGISAGGAQAEINRLRMENAALKQQVGI